MGWVVLCLLSAAIPVRAQEPTPTWVTPIPMRMQETQIPYTPSEGMQGMQLPYLGPKEMEGTEKPTEKPKESEEPKEPEEPEEESEKSEEEEPKEDEEEEMEPCEECSEEEEEQYEEPSDLTIWNLFREGWDTPYQSRSRAGRAPRLHLFQVRQPFLDREVRTNFFYQSGADLGEADEYELNWELEIPFNRRFMLDFEPGYSWVDGKGEEAFDTNGPVLRVTAYLQLVDTYDSAFNVQFRVTAPSPETGVFLSEFGPVVEEENKQTGLLFTFAGFEDLTRSLGLERVGLSYHFTYGTFVGPGPAEDPRNAIIYATSLAKTFREPDARFLADFTTFTEVFGATILDGENEGRTAITLTPGLRWNLAREESPWWFMAGVQFPITGPRPFDYTASIALIHWFD